MQTALITGHTDKAPLSQEQAIGKAYNKAAAKATFADYRSRKAPNTLRRHDNDLAEFARFLQAPPRGLKVGNLSIDPGAWQHITWGLVDGYLKQLIIDGYAIATINARLSTIKVYAKLALRAEALDSGEATRIRTLQGYGVTEAKHVNEKRIMIRQGNSKAAQPVPITAIQAVQLKDYGPGPQARRDGLLFCLLLDHGLRCGELAALNLSDFDAGAGTFTFYRPKVDMIQTHEMSDDTAEALRLYLPHREGLDTDALLVGSMGRNRLVARRMSTRAITKRVRYLGKPVGLRGLSAHDCRHHWATQIAKGGTPLNVMMAAGGWSSPAMPMRYIETAAIANQGVLFA